MAVEGAFAYQGQEHCEKHNGASSRALPSLPRQQGLVRKAIDKCRARGVDARRTPVLIDVGCSAKYATHQVGVLPCLTASRGSAQGRGHWCTSAGRHLTVEELAQFQGLSSDQATSIMRKIRSATPGTAPTEAQVGGRLGNTMSLNVIERVLAKALPAASLAKHVEDRWA